MPKYKDTPEDFNILEAFDECWITLEFVNKDLKKSINRGTKQSGLRARKGLRHAMALLEDVLNASFYAERKIRDKKRLENPHGNQNGIGLKIMQELKKSGKK